MINLQTAETPLTHDDFGRLVSEVQAQTCFRKPLLYAIGGQVLTNGKEPVLASVRYPVVNGPDQNLGTLAVLQGVLGFDGSSPVVNGLMTSIHIDHALRMFTPFANEPEGHRNIQALRAAKAAVQLGRPVAFTAIFEDVDPIGVEDSTLKLYGLSNRFFRPNQLNLMKIFARLPNVAWVGDRPLDEEEVENALMRVGFGDGSFSPQMVDKFPLFIHRMNALALGVRIMDQNKVRLGAYLGDGTVLMPGASYINFNAGTESGMIEGRISSSAMVGKGSDIGGGASILGVLSGGNKTPISVGRNCLLEVNSTLGITIGDAVIVSSNCAVLASTNVKVLLQGHPRFGQVVKAVTLAGISGVTFRRNDLLNDDGVAVDYPGEMHVVRTARNIEFAERLDNGKDILNADLHAHN